MAKTAFPNRSSSDENQLVQLYYDGLSDMEPSIVLANFRNHVKTSTYFPLVKDLREGNGIVKEGTKYIPGVEETALYIESINNMKSDVSEERRKQHLENIRNILFVQED